MCSMQGPGFPTSYVLHTRTWFSNFICPPYQDLVFQLHMSSIPGPGFLTSYVLHTRSWFSNFICPPYQDLVFQLHMSSMPGPGFPTSCVVIFFVFIDLRWEMIVCFVDIGRIVGHHYLHYLFIILLTGINQLSDLDLYSRCFTRYFPVWVFGCCKQ
jgi:hypothetical protein